MVSSVIASSVVNRSGDMELASSVGNRMEEGPNEDDHLEQDPRDGDEYDDCDPEADTAEEAVEVDLDGLEQELPPWMVLAKFHSLFWFTNKGLFDAMAEAWALSAPAEIRPLHVNDSHLFLIVFGSEADLNRVLRGGPWLYMSPAHHDSVVRGDGGPCPWLHVGDALTVAPYDGRARPSEVKLDTVPLWARIYDLPLAFMTEAVGRALGARLGTVLEVEVDEGGRSTNLEFLRVRVELSVDRPILRHLTIRRTGRHEVRYERLPHFCFDCGRIGHGRDECFDESSWRRFSLEQCALPYRRDWHQSWTVRAAAGAQAATAPDVEMQTTTAT